MGKERRNGEGEEEWGRRGGMGEEEWGRRGGMGKEEEWGRRRNGGGGMGKERSADSSRSRMRSAESGWIENSVDA